MQNLPSGGDSLELSRRPLPRRVLHCSLRRPPQRRETWASVSLKNWGTYSPAPGLLAHTRVYALSDVAVGFPAGCGFLILSPATMGNDAYKTAIAYLLTAKSTNRRLRFYAHLERDGGCGVDYVEMQ